MTARALLVVLVAALSISPLSFGSLRTTAPSRTVTVRVVITDKGIKLSMFNDRTFGGSVIHDVMRWATVPRGDYLRFTIVNSGKRVHNFTIFGRKTPALRPSQRAHFNLVAVARGSFV